uniref:putative proline-rich receptor-like protein kinase PERK6 n=1 Tax=Erigeron canadensis TaxID=72917 RepID=UPI001CB9D0ED|nr:putative proline-rich receptor-like protein kinase PERK6 [Erigeron canadensis]
MVCCCKRKKKQQKLDKSYPSKNHGRPKDNGYYNKQQYDWNQHHQSNDIHLKMPPPPSSGPPSSEQGWVAVPPPPPPPGMISSDLSSSTYSAPLPPPHPGIAVSLNTNVFTYVELATATKGFDQSLLLGQGGFGYVHKGVLPNGKEVAVKSLKLDSGQGEREFQAEVEIISRVHHRHLVSLVGYCITGQQRILVYEFISNQTLEYHIHGKNSRVMDCSTRLQIALGAAKGFAYLHEDCNPRIIHRDIKAANILLDEHFEAKVADFGLAKLSSETITHVSTRVMGTFGYLAPEYASTGKLTEKSDVFSYGVVLLELITGKRPINRHNDDENLIDWARPILMHASNGGSFEELVDPRLGDNYDRDEMHRMVACAASTIRHSARMRPKMRQIVHMLEGDVSLDNLNEVGKTMRKENVEQDSHSFNEDNS